MPSITTTDGFTFTNWGPLTTTFTAPASCATATGNYMIGVNKTVPVWHYQVQCSTLPDYDCIPTGTVSPPTTVNENPAAAETRAYFSPGLYCPSGWATRGLAVRDADKGLSSSGVLSSSSTDAWPTFIPQFENPATVLMSLLDPSETLVLCCPESMTADLAWGGCYSTVSDYKITEGCQLVIPATDNGEVTKTIIVDGTTSKHLELIITGTQPLSTTTQTISPSEISRFHLVAGSVTPMLTLVHRQSDLPTATSKSAARATLSTNTWGGLSAFLGVYFVMSVLFT